jgi:hypothetical protein
MAGHLSAMLFIQVHQHFGVGPATKLMTATAQAVAQLLVVVDLAVEDDPDGLILVRHRLSAGARQVEERKPAMNQLTAISRIEPSTVRTAVCEQGICS